MDIMGLSETRRLGSDEINSRGFTYYWSGMSNGARLKGVAIGWELLVWKGGLNGDLHGVIARAGVGGLARRRASWRMPPLID